MASSTSNASASGASAENGLQVQTVERVFKRGSMELPDPDPDLAPDDVREHYATQFPGLTNARVVSKGIDGGREVFEFKESIGTKG